MPQQFFLLFKQRDTMFKILTPQQRDRQAEIERFALGLPQGGRETSANDWRAAWHRIAAQGLLGGYVPSEHGGSGCDLSTAVHQLEALGRGCADHGLTLAVNGHVWTVVEPILRFGTEAQKARWLPGLIDGTLVGADGVTEAESGSDAMALATTARPVAGGFVLNGEKVLVGMAPACDVAIVYATTDPALGRWGVTAFLVAGEDDGFERVEGPTRMGLNTVPSGGFRFRDCHVASDRMLGEEGDGAAIFQHSAEFERCFIFTSHVGAMARQLEESVTHAAGRRVFGQPIDRYQSVSNRLADMRLRLETSRLMLFKAAALIERGDPCGLHAAMTKLHISEAFVASSIDALRNRGGAGYMDGSDTARDLRDALGGVIYGGTSDIQRQIIATLLRPNG